VGNIEEKMGMMPVFAGILSGDFLPWIWAKFWVGGTLI